MKSLVCITGAAGGLGKAFAVECANRGWDLLLTDLSEETLSQLARSLSNTYNVNVHYHCCDLIDIEARTELFDPGLVNTDIGLKGTGGIVRKVWGMRSSSGSAVDKPARAIAYLASEPSARQTGEVYWKDCAPLKPSRFSQREDAGFRLWELSERMCGIKYSLNQLGI